jgi:excinuclease ABC subunit C
VYLFRDRLNRIIYVGKARDLRKRVSQYFHPARRKRADLKTRALIESIWDLEVLVVKSEPESILLEGRLIKDYRPRYNISFRDDKRFLLIKTSLNDPYPRFEFVRARKVDGAKYFGPFAHSGPLRRALALMRKRFGLRSCRPAIPSEKDYKHCLDHIIKNCSAPCIGKITRGEYLARVRMACAFLEGKSEEMTRDLQNEMKKAAEKLDFEKAASLRDTLEDLRLTAARGRSFVREIPSTVVPQNDLEALRDALGLTTPPIAIECFDISNISTTHKVASMAVFRHGRPNRSAYRRYQINSVKGQDDFASMAEVIKRRYTRVLREGTPLPDLIVVDGGKGQLRAALRELEALGLSDQPIVGLAKEREEIFLPGSNASLILPLESGAIRLLQRIRDEAHRVANAYHQLLLRKRMSESLLDEIPGVSERKKSALLRHFGAIKRIRKASSEELRAVEGVGPKLAQAIKAFFAS